MWGWVGGDGVGWGWRDPVEGYVGFGAAPGARGRHPETFAREALGYISHRAVVIVIQTH